MSNYIKLSKRCDGYAAALIAARDFEAVAQEGGKFTKTGAVKGLKDLLAVWTKKEADAQAKVDAAKKENKEILQLEKDLKTAKETKDIIAGLLKGVS